MREVPQNILRFNVCNPHMRTQCIRFVCVPVSRPWTSNASAERPVYVYTSMAWHHDASAACVCIPTPWDPACAALINANVAPLSDESVHDGGAARPPGRRGEVSPPSGRQRIKKKTDNLETFQILIYFSPHYYI